MTIRRASVNDPERHEPLIRIFRSGDRIVATVTRREWFDPDNNGLSATTALVTTHPRPAAEVVLAAKPNAWIWLESDDLWSLDWGPLPAVALP